MLGSFRAGVVEGQERHLGELAVVFRLAALGNHHRLTTLILILDSFPVCMFMQCIVVSNEQRVGHIKSDQSSPAVASEYYRIHVERGRVDMAEFHSHHTNGESEDPSLFLDISNLYVGS